MKVLLIGIGRLGFRYLEGLTKLKKSKIKIFLYDNKISVIQSLKKRIKEQKNIFIIEKLNNLNIKNFDLCILATTASSRHILIKKITETFKIKYWILEKLVSNKLNNLDKIHKLLKNSKVYINLPRSYCKMYQLLKKQKLKKINIKVKGGKWNIGSNSIHHLYLLEWLTSDKITKIKIFKKQFYHTKRKNFYDFYGEIIGQSNFGSKINIINLKNNEKFTTKISNGVDNWFINEHLGYIKKNNKIILKNKFNFQSQITPQIVKFIHNCKLPLLKDVYLLHKKVLIEYNKLGFNRVT